MLCLLQAMCRLGDWLSQYQTTHCLSSFTLPARPPPSNLVTEGQAVFMETRLAGGQAHQDYLKYRAIMIWACKDGRWHKASALTVDALHLSP